MVCLDTDILVAFLRGDSDAVSLVGRHKSAAVTTYINVYELYKGAELSRDKTRNTSLVNDVIEGLHLLPFDIKAVRLSAEIFAELEKKGEEIGDFDILIGAMASAHNETLVTRNVKHFSKIKSLKIEKW